MSRKSKLTINVEYAAVRLICAAVNAIPYPVAMKLASGLGWIGVHVLRLQRRRTEDRIRQVYPSMSARDVTAVATASMQCMLQTVVELMRAGRLDRRWMDRYVKDGQHYKDVLQKLVDEGNGVVILAPHSGNFYMPAWSMAKYELTLVAIGSRQRNPKLDAWMKRQYGDIEFLDRDSRDTLGRIRRSLANGRAFAILCDLRVRTRDVEVEFFGGKANVSHAGAMFAVHAGCPIVVAVMTRENGQHVFHHLATLRPDPAATDKKGEARRLTQVALKMLSDEVMKKPGDWFWYNKRWILEPVSE